MLAITPKYRDALAAIVVELRTNRTVLFDLTNWFSLFVFTGGKVPAAPWSLAATTSYLQQPTAADGGAALKMQRYRGLVQTIVDIGQTGTAPRTLKCRRSMGDRFASAAAELRLLADALEMSMTKITEVA